MQAAPPRQASLLCRVCPILRIRKLHIHIACKNGLASGGAGWIHLPLPADDDLTPLLLIMDGAVDALDGVKVLKGGLPEAGRAPGGVKAGRLASGIKAGGIRASVKANNTKTSIRFG